MKQHRFWFHVGDRMKRNDIAEKVFNVLDTLAEIIGKNMDVVENKETMKVISLDNIDTKFGVFMWAAIIHKKGDFMNIQLLDKDSNVLFEEPLSEFIGLDRRALEDKIDEVVEKMLVKAKQATT